MVNEELKENVDNISPSIQNCVDDQTLRRKRVSISVGSALLKASICTKTRNPLVSKQSKTNDGRTVSKAQQVLLKDRDGHICA